MADEREWRMGVYRAEEDFSEQTQQAIQQAHDFFKNGKLQEALERLLTMEKTTRLGNDTKSTIKLAREVVTILVEARDWEKLMEYVDLLVKKRSQMKQVQSTLVQEAVKAIDLTPTKEVKIQLIQKLRHICEGKIHVELEYARLTVQLANIWDADGKLKEACSLMQGLQVETIGNMERKEKFDIILQQVEMCLRMKDYVVANVMAKKIPPRAIDKPDTLGQKIRFYQLLTIYYTHYENEFMLCNSHREIYNTIFDPAYKPEELGGQFSTEAEKLAVLQTVLIFLWLSPYSATTDKVEEKKKDSKENKEEDTKNINTNAKIELLKQFEADKRLEDLPAFLSVLKQFITLELISWPEFAQKNAELKSHHVFTEKPQRWEQLRKRVTEHNIRVVSNYYNRITLPRLSQLIALPEEEAEEFLCDMVTKHLIRAKINRIDGIVDFSTHKSPQEQLNDWSSGVSKVLALLGTTCHLITKEQMEHKARQELAKASN